MWTHHPALKVLSIFFFLFNQTLRKAMPHPGMKASCSRSSWMAVYAAYQIEWNCQRNFAQDSPKRPLEHIFNWFLARQWHTLL